MILEELLSGPSAAEFVRLHYQKLPFPHRGGAERLAALGSWETLGAILATEDPEVVVARSGEPFAGVKPRTLEAARKLHGEGWTISVQHAEQRHEGLRELAARFAEELAAPVNIHLYLTPAGGHGFGWHYDVEDVFLIQTAGRKDYYLRKNTVNPWPRLETMPRDLGIEREFTPVLSSTLIAGDWLYVPAGYWHVAQAGEESISLAVGLMSATAIDALDRLRGSLVRSLLWRARLPVVGKGAGKSEEALEKDLRAAFQELAKDLTRSLLDPGFIRSFIEKPLLP